VVQVVAYLGWHLAGWRGSAVATIAFLFPSVLLMVALAYGYLHVATLPSLESVRRGVVAVVTALLLATMSRLARQTITTPLARAVAIGGFFVAMLLPSSSPVVVVVAGVLGVASARRVFR
jgi:chromate transporter